MKNIPTFKSLLRVISIIALCALLGGCESAAERSMSDLRCEFETPPDSARPGVYWYFMDGNISKEAMTKDLESMKKAGIGYLVYLEVNVGVPRGDVEFYSQRWKELFAHAVSEAERLGIAITLGVGPGWTGSGGPWVKPQQSMRHLVSSVVEVSGGHKGAIELPLPRPKSPYFGMGSFTPEVQKQWEDFYEDVAVLAFPAKGGGVIEDTDEKALYYRAPYSSVVGVKQYLATEGMDTSRVGDLPIEKGTVIELTDRMKPDGTLDWEVPPGKWTVMRFVARNNGALTRPAPMPGVGMESDKFDTTALNAHLDIFPGQLLELIGQRDQSLQGGLKMLHMDSWEMGAQNWTDNFRSEFAERRGYDPLPFYPVCAGVIVESRDVSERFLWDLRLTSQELIIEKHAGHIKDYAHRHGYGLSIEPYDMNPTADLELAAVADMPMCEYWSVGYGFNTAFSAIEGSSIAHMKGQPVVPAEAFTAEGDAWRLYPGALKSQGDWAFASGINRLVYHTFQHQPLDDNLRPGMAMGPYGVHWDRNQTWWYLSDQYHRYISRCQHMLQQGRTVADILYLAPEGAPHVFRAPESALDYVVYEGIKDLNGRTYDLPDKRGYNFDACPPSLLYGAQVVEGKVTFPAGASYEVLVLPATETMTPALLEKISSLVSAGATVMGVPPSRSPSLSGYPQCDARVQELVAQMWGGAELPLQVATRNVGRGKIVWAEEFKVNSDRLYPQYGTTKEMLATMGVVEDFVASVPSTIRFTHRTTENCEIYFVSNRTDRRVETECLFRVTGLKPELWSATTGDMRALPKYTELEKQTAIKLEFEPYESHFIIFPKVGGLSFVGQNNFASYTPLMTIDGPWEVSFDPKWGGPAKVTFETLTDWTQNTAEGIKYYSGTAVYSQRFTLPSTDGGEVYIDLGEVKNFAKVWLNGESVGTLWTKPWRLDITDYLKKGENELKIEVVNLWPNRMIGDQKIESDEFENGQWPQWLKQGLPRASKRYTYSTFNPFRADSPLLESGLLGPVRVMGASR